MNIQPTDIVDFKKQKLVKTCNECQKGVTLKAYQVALYQIMDILLKLPPKL